MNIFQQHGLTHLSPSQLTTFSADPSLWVAQKLFGLKTPTSPAAMRGRAVETAVVKFLLGSSMEEAQGAALDEFDAGAVTTFVRGMSDAALKERDGLPEIVQMALTELIPLGTPRFPAEGGQMKISLPVRFGDEEDDVIELMGYLDLDYEDEVVDLKTTLRMPSEMSWNHTIQHAVYSRAVRPRPVRFLYVTPKKAEFLTRTEDEIAVSQAQVRLIVRRMAAFLALGDAETLRASVPVIMDGWSWKGIEDQRLAVLGI